MNTSGVNGCILVCPYLKGGVALRPHNAVKEGVGKKETEGGVKECKS